MNVPKYRQMYQAVVGGGYRRYRSSRKGQRYYANVAGTALVLTTLTTVNNADILSYFHNRFCVVIASN